MRQQSHNKCVEVTHWLKKHVCILRGFFIFPGTAVQNSRNISRTKNDKKGMVQSTKTTKYLVMIVMMYHVSNKFLNTNQNLVSNEPSLTILSIDRSVPRFKSHKARGLNKNILQKQLNQVQNCCGQIKKMKARTFSFPLKKICLPVANRWC